MSKIPQSAGDAPDVDPGVYPAYLVSARDDHLDNSRFGTGDVVRLGFQLEGVTDEDGKPVVLDAIANVAHSPKAKLTKWGATLLGLKVDDFAAEPEIDPEDWVQSPPLQALVTVEREDTNSWPRIKDLTAMPSARSRARTSRTSAKADTPPAPEPVTPTPANTENTPEFVAEAAALAQIAGQKVDDIDGKAVIKALEAANVPVPAELKAEIAMGDFTERMMNDGNLVFAADGETLALPA